MPPFLKTSTPRVWGALLFGKEKTMDEKSAENMQKKLTGKEEKFCREYVIDLNGTQAAIRAGYSPNSARQIASRLLTKDYIRSRVHAIQIEECEKKSINEHSVLSGFQEVYERCMQLKPAKVWDTEKHEYVECGQYTFNPKGANTALTKMGEYLGMFKQNVNANVNGSINSNVKIEDLID